MMPDSGPLALQDALARLAAYRAARVAGDPAAIRAAEADIAAAASNDARGRAAAAIRNALAPVLAREDATEAEIAAAEADAWHNMDRAARRAIMEGNGEARQLPRAMSAVAAAKLPRPPRLLSAANRNGAILSIGETCLLAGAGGVGKSALAGEIALAVADPAGEHGRRTAGELLDIHGGPGPVLWLAYEEAPGEIGARLAALANATMRDDAPAAVHILDMRGWPLYGPGERHGATGLYSARPEPLDGWQAMTEAAAAWEPRLIVIDPTLSAYVGEGNAVPPVREFLAALAALARQSNAGVLALAHSTKAARGGRNTKPDPFDPGQIAGSAAWHDGVRGALVLDYEEDTQADPDRQLRRLAVTKANMGPARILCPAIPRRRGGGSDWILGFHSDPRGPGWHAPDNGQRQGNDARERGKV